MVLTSSMYRDIPHSRKHIGSAQLLMLLYEDSFPAPSQDKGDQKRWCVVFSHVCLPSCSAALAI